MNNALRELSERQATIRLNAEKEAEAREQALVSLSQSISVQIKSDLTHLLEEMNRAADPDARAERLIDIINVGTRAGKQEHDDRTMLFGVLK